MKRVAIQMQATVELLETLRSMHASDRVIAAAENLLSECVVELQDQKNWWSPDGPHHLGFTGTQHGLTDAQRDTLDRLLFESNCSVLHHGDCIGADAEAHQIGRKCGMFIVGHPPINQEKRAFCSFDEERPADHYLVRNCHIVEESESLVACPMEPEEQLRSGTWATVRYAREAGKPITIINPDGSTK